MVLTLTYLRPVGKKNYRNIGTWSDLPEVMANGSSWWGNHPLDACRLHPPRFRYDSW